MNMAPIPRSAARTYAPSVTASAQSTASIPKRTNLTRYLDSACFLLPLVTGIFSPRPAPTRRSYHRVTFNVTREQRYGR